MLLPMSDELKSRVQKLRIEAADCDMISFLADDARKRALFQKLARDLRSTAGEIEAMNASREAQRLIYVHRDKAKPG